VTVRFVALPTELVDSYRRGEPDGYGRIPERQISDGGGLPCRHCLQDIAEGDEYLVLAHRPFTDLQPYAETGPIFVHADACRRHPETSRLPDVFLGRPQFMVRGYDAGERIVYGTGAIVETDRLAEVAGEIIARPDVEFVHVRSASNGCFQCRIDNGHATSAGR
jgi:Protein of unknown function (DUF1203)